MSAARRAALALPVAALALLGPPEGEAAQSCLGKPVTIAGTSGEDVVRGTSQADVISTGAGDDRVNGLGGNDRICLGGGDDRANGGLGKDRIKGARGRDRLTGGPVFLSRSECVDGSWHVRSYRLSPAKLIADADSGQPCSADPPAPLEREGFDADRLDGGPGRDRLGGGGGDDLLLGGGSRDRLDGRLGNDRLDGGRGNDRVTGGPVTLVRYECIDGSWQVVEWDISTPGQPKELSRTNTSQPCDAPTPPPPTTEAGSPTSVSDDDRLSGSSGKDRLVGGRGNDKLRGGSGDDRLDGGPDEDTLRGGRGYDVCENGERLFSCEGDGPAARCSLLATVAGLPRHARVRLGCNYPFTGFKVRYPGPGRRITNFTLPSGWKACELTSDGGFGCTRPGAVREVSDFLIESSHQPQPGKRIDLTTFEPDGTVRTGRFSVQ